MRISCVKNGLVVGVILLFVGVAVQPSVAIEQPEEETKRCGLFWGTYRNCKIDGWHYDMYPNGRKGFAFIVLNGVPFASCTLDGAKGKIAVSNIIGFGFVGTIEWYHTLREEVRIYGRLLFCIYIKDLNPS